MKKKQTKNPLQMFFVLQATSPNFSYRKNGGVLKWNCARVDLQTDRGNGQEPFQNIPNYQPPSAFQNRL
jgi:hypothetical protein